MQNTKLFVELSKFWGPKSFSVWEEFEQKQGTGAEKGFDDLLMTLPSLSDGPHLFRGQLIAATFLAFPLHAPLFAKRLVDCPRVVLVNPSHDPRLFHCVLGVFLGMCYLDQVGVCDSALEMNVALFLERAMKEELTQEQSLTSGFSGRLSNLVARFFEKKNEIRLRAIGLAFENLAAWAYQNDTDRLSREGRISLVAGSYFGSVLLVELMIKVRRHVRMGPLVKLFGQELTGKRPSS